MQERSSGGGRSGLDTGSNRQLLGTARSHNDVFHNRLIADLNPKLAQPPCNRIIGSITADILSSPKEQTYKLAPLAS